MRKPAPAGRPRSPVRPRTAKAAAPDIGETEFHLQAADLLRRGIPPTAGFFFHVPNQGKRSVQTGALFKGMGMLPGMTDLVLVAAPTLDPPDMTSTVGFLELKVGKGKLSTDQETIRDLCRSMFIPWAEARTLAEVEAFARQFYATFGVTFRARVQ